MMELYQANQKYALLTSEIKSRIDDEQDVTPLLGAWDLAAEDVKEAIKEFAKTCREYKAIAKAADDESRRLKQRAIDYNDKCKRFEDLIAFALTTLGEKKIVYNEFDVSIRESESVTTEDDVVLPPDFYLEPLPQKPRPDKRKIKERLKAGVEIAGCTLVKTKHVLIK